MIAPMLPAPRLSLMLLVTWLLLTGISVGQALLGALIAIVIPHLLPARAAGLQTGTTWAVLRLMCVVLVDIVVSAVVLARLICGPIGRIQPRFIDVPLRLTDPRGIATLASIITMTPGTLTVDVASDRTYLRVHAFHLVDPEVEVARIRQRYEEPLLRLFGGSA